MHDPVHFMDIFYVCIVEIGTVYFNEIRYLNHKKAHGC